MYLNFLSIACQCGSQSSILIGYIILGLSSILHKYCKLTNKFFDKLKALFLILFFFRLEKYLKWIYIFNKLLEKVLKPLKCHENYLKFTLF